MLASSSTGLRTQSRGAGGSGANAQREQMIRQNNPSVAVRGARGCATLLSCGCVRKRMRQAEDSATSDLPSARTLHGHIHDPRDVPTANANGTVRERKTRTKEQVRLLSAITASQHLFLVQCFAPRLAIVQLTWLLPTHSVGLAKSNPGTPQSGRNGRKPQKKLARRTNGRTSRRRCQKTLHPESMIKDQQIVSLDRFIQSHRNVCVTCAGRFVRFAPIVVALVLVAASQPESLGHTRWARGVAHVASRSATCGPFRLSNRSVRKQRSRTPASSIRSLSFDSNFHRIL
jgi:hypothetical protein